ncbi:unnamed protein product [Rhizophagus irregularis]|nr:unnamed protein product [Rhizophagus irregularis]
MMACFSGLDALEKAAWKTCRIQVHSSLQLENLNFKFQELDSKSGFFFGDFECADYDGSSVLWMFKCRISITGSSVFLNVFGREFYGWFQTHGKLISECLVIW